MRLNLNHQWNFEAVRHLTGQNRWLLHSPLRGLKVLYKNLNMCFASRSRGEQDHSVNLQLRCCMPAREILNFTPCLVFFVLPSAWPPCRRAIARFHCASGASELNNLDILTDWSSEVEKISGWGGYYRYMSKCVVQFYTCMCVHSVWYTVPQPPVTTCPF